MTIACIYLSGILIGWHLRSTFVALQADWRREREAKVNADRDSLEHLIRKQPYTSHQ